VSELEIVTLDGSGSSDPESSNLTYSWRQLFPGEGEATITLDDPSSAKPTFTAPNVLDGFAQMNLIFRLTVSDGELSNEDDVTITVNKSKVAPLGMLPDDKTVFTRNANDAASTPVARIDATGFGIGTDSAVFSLQGPSWLTLAGTQPVELNSRNLIANNVAPGT
jgi:hypothetical protein